MKNSADFYIQGTELGGTSQNPDDLLRANMQRVILNDENARQTGAIRDYEISQERNQYTNMVIIRNRIFFGLAGAVVGAGVWANYIYPALQ